MNKITKIEMLLGLTFIGLFVVGFTISLFFLIQGLIHAQSRLSNFLDSFMEGVS